MGRARRRRVVLVRDIPFPRQSTARAATGFYCARLFSNGDCTGVRLVRQLLLDTIMYIFLLQHTLFEEPRRPDRLYLK